MFFPVAGVEISPLVPPLVGLAVGTLSGLFGVGGGFLMTPALIWVGVPPAVAVGSGLNQMVAASSSGAVLNAGLGNVSLRLGSLVAAGGLVAGLAGTFLVRALLRGGAFGPALGAAYVLVLLAIGAGMILESLRRRAPERGGAREPVTESLAADAAAVGAGLVAGLVSAVLGLGGGIILVPAMIYVLRIPTRVAVGTCLFVALCISFGATVFHSTLNGTVDVLLAALLMLGSVPGSCLGVWLGRKLRTRALRGLLGGVLVLAAAKMLWDVAGGRLGPGGAAGGQLNAGRPGAFAEWLRASATDHGVLYGIAAAVLALVVGGTAGALLRGRVCEDAREASDDVRCPPGSPPPEATGSP